MFETKLKIGHPLSEQQNTLNGRWEEVPNGHTATLTCESISLTRLCRCVSGLFSSIFWEQGFDKVRESSRSLELFEQFDVQFQKWRICLFSWS